MMKTTIYYFTGTGNSLKYARDLAGELGETELISIIEAVKLESLPMTDRIGIVFPVYIWGLPLIVNRFLKKLSKENRDKYIFAIATNGGTVAGSLLLVEKRLHSMGLKLSAGFSVVLPSNYISMHETSIEEQQQLFEAADIKLKEIVTIIKANNSYPIERGSLSEQIWKTGLIHRITSPMIHKMDHSFWTDKNCNSCGLCSKVCPVQNIIMKNDVPKWRHKCEQCHACLNLCPKQALQFGKMTVGKERYKNPFVTLKDLTRS